MAPRTPKAAWPDDQRLKRLERFAELLDSRFSLPGTGVRFGLDGLLGLIPGIGDTVTALSALYIVAQARRLGVRKRVLLRMLLNIAADGIVGAVPLLGDVLDFAWKTNTRNLRLLRRDLAAQARRSTPGN